MLRSRAMLGALAGAALAAGVATPAWADPSRAGGPAGMGAHATVADPFTRGSGRLVADWNKTLISILSKSGVQPATIHPTRSFASLQAAEYDAVVSVTRAGRQYLFRIPVFRPADAAAAADQAAHDVLAELYPGRADVADSQLATELAAISDSPARQRGVEVGKAVAARLLAIRSTDGSAAPPPSFVPGTAPGDYQPTPPGFAAPAFTGWGNVNPFVLNNGAQFRPAPPPSVTSGAYKASLAVTKNLGQDNSTTRTADQTTAGKDWSSTPVWNVERSGARSGGRA